MRVIEEIVILILDRETGTFRHSLSEHRRNLVIAGAVLMDLALENRIDTDPERLRLLDPTPLDDDLLDPILADIAEETEAHDTPWWLARTANQSANAIVETAIGRLSDRGILSRDQNGAVFLARLVARLHRYPTTVGEVRDDVETRMLRALFSDDIPDPRDIPIVALAAACSVFEAILSSEDLAEVRERIALLSRMDLIGRTVGAAVRAVAPPPVLPTSEVRPCEEIPLVPGLPILGNGLQMAGDLNAFFVASYQRYGPIFRVRAPGRRFIVLAGPEANEFVTKISATHLRSFETYVDFNAAGGAHRVVASMDGQEHLRMRKLLAKGYSPKTLEAHLDAVHDLTRGIVAAWPEGRPMGMQSAMRAIVAEQIGWISTGVPAKDYVDDVSVYLDTLVAVNMSHLRPTLAQRLPRFRRAERRLKDFVDNVLAAHEPERRAGEAPDLVDNLLDVHRLDPQFLPETDLFINIVGAFFVGIDTSANVCAFMLYSLLKHPDLMERVRAEVDAMFERGPPTPEGLGSLDVTHRVAMETMRLYPIVPALTRIASNSFEFGGYSVPAGENILVGSSVGSHLPECFPDPERFDIERWTAPSREVRKAYAPMGLGRHRCLGASLAEQQIALTMATIVRETEIVLEKPDRVPKIRYLPVRHLDDSTEMRVLHRDTTVPVRESARAQSVSALHTGGRPR